MDGNGAGKFSWWWSEGKKAFVTTVIALLFNPASIVLGYFLARYMALPKITVQYVIMEPKMEPLRLTEQQLFSSKSLERSWFKTRVPFCKSAITKNSFTDDCIQHLLNEGDEVLLDLNDEYGAYRASVATLEKADPRAPLLIGGMLGIPGVSSIHDAITRDRAGTLEKVHEFEQQMLAHRNAFEQLLTMVKASLATPRARSGEARFTVGLLNTGESDGVVTNVAKITLANRNAIQLKAVDPVTVKAHNIEKMQFAVDEMKSLPEDLGEWKTAVKNPQSQPYELEIYAGKNATTFAGYTK